LRNRAARKTKVVFVERRNQEVLSNHTRKKVYDVKEKIDCADRAQGPRKMARRHRKFQPLKVHEKMGMIGRAPMKEGGTPGDQGGDVHSGGG